VHLLACAGVCELIPANLNAQITSSEPTTQELFLISGLVFSGVQVLRSKRAEFKNTKKKSILKNENGTCKSTKNMFHGAPKKKTKKATYLPTYLF
jgi:hypothetical protein